MSSIPRRPLPMELLAEIFHNIRLPKSNTATIEDCDQIVQIFSTSKCALQFAGRPMFKQQLKHLLIRLISRKIDQLICQEVQIGWDISDIEDLIEESQISEEEKAIKLKSEIIELEEMKQQIGHQIQELSARKRRLLFGIKGEKVEEKMFEDDDDE